MNYDTVWLLSTRDVLTNLVTTLLKPPITTPHTMKRAWLVTLFLLLWVDKLCARELLR